MPGANIPFIAPVGKPLFSAMAQTNRFDYVVVGAGSAGCVLAARLSEDANTRVALIEAGDEGVKIIELMGEQVIPHFQ